MTAPPLSGQGPKDRSFDAISKHVRTIPPPTPRCADNGGRFSLPPRSRMDSLAPFLDAVQILYQRLPLSANGPGDQGPTPQSDADVAGIGY